MKRRRKRRRTRKLSRDVRTRQLGRSDGDAAFSMMARGGAGREAVVTDGGGGERAGGETGRGDVGISSWGVGAFWCGRGGRVGRMVRNECFEKVGEYEGFF